jgi:hypothetical protein
MDAPTPMERFVRAPERSFTVDLAVVTCVLVSLFAHGLVAYGMWQAAADSPGQPMHGNRCERRLYGRDLQWQRRLEGWNDALRVEIQWRDPPWGSNSRVVREETVGAGAAAALADVLRRVEHWDRCICWTCCGLRRDLFEPRQVFRIIRADGTEDEVPVWPWDSVGRGDVTRSVLLRLQHWFARYGMYQSALAVRAELLEAELAEQSRLLTTACCAAVALFVGIAGVALTRTAPKPAKRRSRRAPRASL